MPQPDLSKLSDADLQAVASGDVSKLSTEALQHITGDTRPPTSAAASAPKERLDPSLGASARAATDVLETVGSGMAQQAAGVPQHLSTLVNSLLPKSLADTPEQQAEGQRRTEKLQELLRHDPKTPEGRYLLENFKSLMEPVSRLASDVRGASEATIGKPATDVASDVIGLAGLKGAGSASKAAGALKAAESTQSRVTRIIENISGKSLEKSDTGAVVQKAAGSTVARAKEAGSAAYDELSKAMGPGTSVDLAESTKAAQHYGAGLVVDPKVAAVSKKLQSVGSMTFDSLKTLRSQIDDLMGSDKNVNRQLRGLRTAVTKDIEKAAEKLSPEAKKAWDTANAKWKAYKQAEDQITRVLGKNWEGKTPAEMYAKLFRVARSDPQKVKTVMESIKDPAVKRQFSASVLHQMSDKGGEFDGDKLVRNWQSMDPQARKELFGPVGGNYEANMTKLIHNLERIKEGHTGMLKELGGVGVAATIAHFIPGGTLAVGGITLAREAYKFGPKGIEAYLTSPQWVRNLAERTTAVLERGGGHAVVATQQANRLGDMGKPSEPARLSDVQ